MGTRRTTGLVAGVAAAAIVVGVVLAGQLVNDEGPDTRAPLRTAAPSAAVDAIDVEWSADGTQLLVVDAGGIEVRDASTGEVVRRIDAGITVATARWRSDRASVALADAAGVLEIWDVATGTSSDWAATGSAPDTAPVAWRPDGSQLAAAGADGAVSVHDTVSGDVVATIMRTPGTAVVDLAWLDEGRLLVTTASGIEEWDVTAGTPGIAIGLEGIVVSTPSPDGTEVAVGRTDASVHDVVQLADGTRVSTIETKTPTIRGFAWSPDGRWLFVTADDDRPRLWDATEQATRDEYVDTRPTADVGAWSPDSRSIAMADVDDDLVAIEGVVSGDTTRLGLGDATGPIVGLDWSPDGSAVAAVLADGTTVVWDVADLS